MYLWPAAHHKSVISVIYDYFYDSAQITTEMNSGFESNDSLSQ